jgi:hypothetical protein
MPKLWALNCPHSLALKFKHPLTVMYLILLLPCSNPWVYFASAFSQENVKTDSEYTGRMTTDLTWTKTSASIIIYIVKPNYAT